MSKTIVTLLNGTRKFYSGEFIRFHYKRKMSVSMASITQIGKEKETFQDVLPNIINTLSRHSRVKQLPDVGKWIKKVLDYNLTGGKKTRGLITVLAYETLEQTGDITVESMRLARTLGWCIEMLQAYLLVVDDIMDGSKTRRGMPCWYRLPNVGLGALNDSILIHCSIYETLKYYFSDMPHYVELLHLFNESLLLTSMGQHLDYTMAHRNKNDYSLFVIEHYHTIVKHKTAYYSYKLPIFASMLLTQNTNTSLHEDMEDICLELGKLFQIQDDYIDCYGDESVSGKKGTDIEEGKCTWLAVQALELCNDWQREEFVACYGSKEAERVARVKRLYEELRLPELYARHESQLYDGLLRRIRALPSEPIATLFTKLLDITYKRKQ